jgi:uncharacterized membrane protein required for colicin V production
MNGLDIFALVCLGIFGSLGLKNGMVKEVFGLAVWLVSIYLSWSCYTVAASWFLGNFEGMDPLLANGLGIAASFLIPFVLLSVGVHLLNKLVKSLAPLRFLNRLGGFAVGGVKAILLCAVVCAVLHALPVQGALKAFRDTSRTYSIALPLLERL